MTIFKFTEARIRDLPLGSGIHRDTDVKGLMCICHKTCKTFAVQSDVRRERTARPNREGQDRTG